ncbi:SDR family NAD(P)-dependent oxidoreductase [Desulfatirhabdium butyrativorans]|uniref:SDR family NAD(P)-dependent oxidoreductase n=1 Tax=Desulfatirhabdium butyrativorans TaxID=340467 RepID=UPI000410DE4C|nr:glucose 1-dehydrogenase [Desulfatirhabdium butyrativorans]
MNLPYFDLTGKVAVVSGGATGIGRGIAEGLAEAGAGIAIVARRLDVCTRACEEIENRYKARAIPFRCDITRSEDIEAMVEGVVQAFGRIDILVNNAGIGGSEKPILEMTEADWDSVVNTNLKAVFMLSKSVVARMVRQGEGGKIINVASIGALIGWPNMSAYCSSKGGCVQLTRVMALEWARYNIQANAILPGYVETPMNTALFAGDIGKKIIKTSIPMKRLARIEEMKGVGVLLASPASSFMTGSAVVVDGGQTCF